jgi:hypothetical protein
MAQPTYRVFSLKNPTIKKITVVPTAVQKAWENSLEKSNMLKKPTRDSPCINFIINADTITLDIRPSVQKKNMRRNSFIAKTISFCSDLNFISIYLWTIYSK